MTAAAVVKTADATEKPFSKPRPHLRRVARHSVGLLRRRWHDGHLRRCVPIMVMVGVLEAAKLVTCAWLARHWRVTPWLLRVPLTVTSGGFFAFRSTWHSDSLMLRGARSKIGTLSNGYVEKMHQ
jgi:hypothetical protein